jgi:hypothetical protein
VLVQPMTYIFDEEPLRWQRLLENLGKMRWLCGAAQVGMASPTACCLVEAAHCAAVLVSEMGLLDVGSDVMLACVTIGRSSTSQALMH